MTRRSLLNFVCTCLLLFAQQGALTHWVWHLGRHAPAQSVEAEQAHGFSEHGERSPQSKLCDLHLAMGSLLAGDCPSQGVPDAVALPWWLATSTAVWCIAQLVVTPPSRAPPVLL